MNGCVLLLAAGSASRFGSDKRLAPTPQGPLLLSATISRYLCLDWPIYVVTRVGENALRQRVTEDLGNHQQAARPIWVDAEQASLGMGHSLGAGCAAALAAGMDLAMVGLGDMPFVTPETLQKIQRELCDAPRRIIRPRYLQRAGNPVGFGQTDLVRLQQLSGDQGARALLQQEAQRINWVEVDDPGILQDIDQPKDLLQR